MPTASDWLSSFPVRLGVLSAAVAAASGLLFPAVLIPENLGIVGPAGSILIMIVFLVAWALEKELGRRRRPLFVLLGVAAIVGLGPLVLINTRNVASAEMGEPAATHRFVVGTELTPWGAEKWAESGSTNNSEFVQRIGVAGIEPAWGASLHKKQNEYMAAYLVLCVALTLMMAVGLANQEQRQNAPAPEPAEPEDAAPAAA